MGTEEIWGEEAVFQGYQDILPEKLFLMIWLFWKISNANPWPVSAK
jgi:hypothetical protein